MAQWQGRLALGLAHSGLRQVQPRDARVQYESAQQWPFRGPHGDVAQREALEGAAGARGAEHGAQHRGRERDVVELQGGDLRHGHEVAEREHVDERGARVQEAQRLQWCRAALQLPQRRRDGQNLPQVAAARVHHLGSGLGNATLLCFLPKVVLVRVDRGVDGDNGERGRRGGGLRA